jgi:hypothetical protein
MTLGKVVEPPAGHCLPSNVLDKLELEDLMNLCLRLAWSAMEDLAQKKKKC